MPYVMQSKSDGTLGLRRGFPGKLGGRSFVHIVMVTILQWMDRATQRRQLAAMDMRQLKDIGLTRDQAEAEADKPFWIA